MPVGHRKKRRSMATLRTFIAVDLPVAVRQSAFDLIGELQGTEANVKWVEESQLHWTLKFLGEISTRDMASVCRAMTKAVAKVPAFHVNVHGAGAFPTAERPRTIWLGASEGVDSFVALHEELEKTFEPLGFRSERRRFRPHITLGRVRRSPNGVAELGGLIQEKADYEVGSMHVKEVIAFASRLERSGPTYEVLGRASLAK